jgi:histidinol-phosphate aminotransferase
VRGAYAIAPLGSELSVSQLSALAPSWPLGAHGVALLQAWVTPQVQAWLAQCLPTLRDWKARQVSMLTELGWTCLPSEANFFCARPAAQFDDLANGWATELLHLREQGIKLRDAASFGLPGHARLGVLPPLAQAALQAAWQSRRG